MADMAVRVVDLYDMWASGGACVRHTWFRLLYVLTEAAITVTMDWKQRNPFEDWRTR